MSYSVSGSLAVADVPLCVDLDGTLVKTDTLLESAVAMLRRNPFRLFAAVSSLFFGGLSRFKLRIQTGGSIRPDLLPFNSAVLDLIDGARAEGRTIVLVTASSQSLANEIADVLGCFDEVYGTEGDTNLKGKKKAAFLVDKFGYRGYDYVGDSPADVPVWESARVAFATGHNLPALKQVPVVGLNSKPVPAQLRLLAKTARVHQWSKNLLVIVPLLTSHTIAAAPMLAHVAAAICSLSCLASATYILNDIFDIEADRLHASKRFRPIPSGDMPIAHAVLLGVILASIGVICAACLPPGARVIIALYVVVTLCYTFYLKQKLLVDCLVLAGLYTLRVLLGGAVIGISISFWLLAFSLFSFVSLALVKRATELRTGEARAMLLRRGYQKVDHQALVSIGISSGLMATLVLALYLNSQEVRHLYARPDFLWLMVPLSLYWFSRVWILVERDIMHDDPLVFVFRDRVSRIVSVTSLLILAAATFGTKLPLGWLIH